MGGCGPNSNYRFGCGTMSVLVFLATHALPSNAAALILGQYSTPETQAALEH